ncbi:MAG: hypothetical protein V4813_02345 [Gemmatimonadota bacterium]
MNPPSDAIGRYRLALEREAELSAFWGRYLGLDARLLQIPNGFIHHRRVLAIAPLLRVALPVFGVLWALVGLPLLAMTWALRWTCTGGWPRRLGLPPVVYLHASNDRNLAFVPAAADRPNAALTLPWRANAPPGPWALERIDLRAVSSRAMVWRAAWLGVCAAVQTLFSTERARVLFTYSAPTWMWVHEVLATAPMRTIWMSNHVDRWASLATSFPGVDAIIVQHGDLAHWDVATDTRIVPTLTTKLTAVARVFVTDAESIDDFVAAVTGPSPEFTRIELGMRSEPWSVAPGVTRLLVIGHPDAQDAVARLLRALEERAVGGFAVAYRPHPTESRPVVLPQVAMERVSITDGGSVVPHADVVLSYGSSVTGEIVRATDAILVRWNPNDVASIDTAVEAVLDAAARHRQATVPARR